jgi:hypothetical protein
MTCPAAPALFLMHMKPVKIDVSVPEVCYVPRLFSSNESFLVAEETEAVFPLFILRIKLVRKGQSENKGIVRAVGIVTGCTIALHYRAVEKPSLFPYFFLFVAVVTEAVNFIDEEIFFL